MSCSGCGGRGGVDLTGGVLGAVVGMVRRMRGCCWRGSGRRRSGGRVGNCGVGRMLLVCWAVRRISRS